MITPVEIMCEAAYEASRPASSPPYRDVFPQHKATLATEMRAALMALERAGYVLRGGAQALEEVL